MKLINFVAFSMAATLLFSLSACGDAASTDNGTAPNTDTTATVNTTPVTNALPTDGRFSYAFGMLIGKNFSEGLGLVLNEVNIDEVGTNLMSVLNGSKTPEEIKAAQMLVNTEAQKLSQFKQSGQGTKTVSPQLSSNLGVFFGNALKTQGIGEKDLNIDDFNTGLKAAMGEGTPTMDFQAAETIVNGQMQALQKSIGERNLAVGEKFLAEEVAKKPGIQKTASGIYYEVLKKGTGPKPTADKKVTTHYHGTLIDGTVFDSSVERGEPIEFPINGVIAGWQEILPMMATGGKWRVYIPSNLAYGPKGSPGGIPPNSALIFEIELFSFI